MQKKTLLKSSKDIHESDRLFAELDGLQWLQRQIERYSFGHGLSNFNEKDFENHLKLQKKSNSKQIFCYAQKYKDVLLTGDAKVLTILPSAQRDMQWKG